MKRTTFLGVVFITALFLIFFWGKSSNEILIDEQKIEVRGMFLSYIDLENHFGNQTEITIRKEIDEIVSNLQVDKFNLLILQVRSHMDAIYPSSLFPKSSYLEKINFDSFNPLSYFLTKCHEASIQVYAWINPYRIGNQTIESITNLPYYPVISNCVCNVGEILYLNPSCQQSTELLLQGIEELLQYSIDGILFDDYFYPSMDIDQKEFELSGMNDVAEFHLAKINDMMRQVYNLIHSYGKVFGVSPSGNIENNYSTIGADVYTWAKEDGYVDFLMPQIYYGFQNETKPFVDTVKDWNHLILNDHVSLYIALALYKEDTEDRYAGTGNMEWVENDDILKRQVILSRNLSHYSGFSIFRYDNAYQNNSNEYAYLKEIF